MRCPGRRRINWPALVSISPIPTTENLRPSTPAPVRPATILTVQSGLMPPYSQSWNFSIQRVLATRTSWTYVTSVTKERICLVSSKRTPPSTAPGRHRKHRPTASLRKLHHGWLLRVRFSRADREQQRLDLSRPPGGLLTPVHTHLLFLASYWWSKSLDYVSSLNLAGSAPTLVAGENDLAQNPFDLRAEHGPSLFDSTHRFVLSGTYTLPKWQNAPP